MENASHSSRPLGGHSVLLYFMSLTNTWAVVVGFTVTVLTLRAFYNVFFHPLAKFRGPRLAAMSTFWLYFNSRDGRIEQKLELLHKKYKTAALRISPYELHIADSKLYHQVYAQNTPFQKEPSFYAAFGAPHTAFSEDNKDLHRQRRKAMSPFFSKSRVSALQTLLASKIDVCCERLSTLESRGDINIYNAFRCMTVDIITEYAFGKSFDLLHEVKNAKFEARILGALDEVAGFLLHFYQFPALRWLLAVALPNLLAPWGVSISSMGILVKTVKDTVTGFQRSRSSHKSTTRDVVFDSLVDLSSNNLEAEAIDILIAGSDTTASTLATAVFHICTNEVVRTKLLVTLNEYAKTQGSNMNLLSLEELQYLSACVKESLRIAMPVPGRLPRIVPNPQPNKPAFIVDGLIVPPRTVISMSAYSVHFDEEIWGSNARLFVPERWLKAEARELEHYLVTFSKGARLCLGINLAYAEVTMTLAKLFLRFDIRVNPSCTAAAIEGLDRFTKAFHKGGICVSVEDRADDYLSVEFV